MEEIELLDEGRLVEKIRELPLTYRKQVIDFIEYLQLKAQRKETLYLSEKSLSYQEIGFFQRKMRHGKIYKRRCSSHSLSFF